MFGIFLHVLSAVVLGTPINSDITLEQVIGRIIRLHKGKKAPVVMDIVLKSILYFGCNFVINLGHLFVLQSPSG